MNVRDLEYLVAVAEHGHFGRAAQACYVSQPTLSTQIRKLEAELGVELIERRRQGTTLTDVGERVVAHARAAIAQIESIQSVAEQATDPEAGTVRLGLFPTLAPYLLPHVVGPLHERFPRLELLLVEEKTEVIVDRLRAGTLDAGLLALPLPTPSGVLITKTLFTEDFVLAVPKSHKLVGHDGLLPVSQIANEDLLLLEEGHCLRDQALSVCQMTGARERRGFRATSLETLRQMVAADVGVTLLPKLAVTPPVPASSDVVLVPFAEPVPNREIVLCWRTSHVRGSLLEQIGDVIRVQIDSVLIT